MLYLRFSSHLVVDLVLVSATLLLLLCLTCCRVTWAVKIANSKDYRGVELLDIDIDNDDEDHFVHDLAIKLKKEFADDLVSDLFGTSYGLEKVARISDFDKDNRLFQFKFNDESTTTSSSTSSSYKLRRKRSEITSILDLISQDDRVEFVEPQRYLNREKRSRDNDVVDDDYDLDLDFISEEELRDLIGELERNKKMAAKTRDDISALDIRTIDRRLENIYDDILEQVGLAESKIEKRRKWDYMFDEFEKKQTRPQIGSLDLPEQIAFNDEKYNQQWYLINEGQLKIPLFHDLNVKNAWLNGYTGKNVVIAIMDDGLDYEHPDFEGKYRADLSLNLNGDNNTKYDPMPSTFDNRNNHGTRCAGAAVAKANNSACGVGVAYDAQIAAIKILDGPITDLLEARALSYKAEDVHIRSASWGPKDDGSHMEYPGRFVNLALEDGVKSGRNGKGTLFIWASGNGGENDDDCSCDGYVSHWNIISIGAVNHRGLKPYFMETCPSIMAVVYSGGLTTKNDPTEQEEDPGVRVVASDVRGKCTSTFQGTSSAAPLAAGALALVLEANPELTYRDVMYLIARTSRIPNVEDTDGWIINGAKYHVSEKYGFGVLDISQMLQEAQTWKNVGERLKCEVVYDKTIPDFNEDDDKVVIELTVTDQCNHMNSLEHVIANISMKFESRGDVKITLISPSHTPSELLSYRRNDHSPKGVRYFPFMTVFNWGETPRGTWQLVVEPRTRPNAKRPNTGTIDFFSLVFYGTNFDESKQETAVNTKLSKRFVNPSSELKSRAFRATEEEVKEIYNTELNLYRQTRIISKRVLEAHPEIRDMLKNVEPNPKN